MMFWVTIAALHAAYAAGPRVSDTPWQVAGLTGEVTESGSVSLGTEASNPIHIHRTVLPAHPKPGTGGVCHVRFRRASGSWSREVTGPCLEPLRAPTEAAIADWSLSVEDQKTDQFLSLVVVFWPDADAAVSVIPGSLNKLLGPTPTPDFLVDPTPDGATKCEPPEAASSEGRVSCRYSVTVDGEGRPAGIKFTSCDATVIPAAEAMVEACRFDPWIAYGKGRSYTVSTETFHARP